MKLDRIDDDAEEERDEEVMCDCFFPQCKVSPGSSPWRRRTKCEVRQDSFGNEHIVVAESDPYPHAVFRCFMQDGSTKGSANQFANLV